MIVTCASCLTKFNLDESRIPAKGAKVRCSRCQYVFFIVPSGESKEEAIEDFETFARQHEELIEPGQIGTKKPPQPSAEERGGLPEEEEEAFLFPERAAAKKVGRVTPQAFEERERAEAKPSKPKRMVRRRKRGPSIVFSTVIILILLVFGVFYLWTEWESKGNIAFYLEYPVKKATVLWEQIFGVKQEPLLIVGDLNRYDERVGGFSLSVIEGKVKNQSRFAKKHIKIKVVIFDQNKIKVTEKETICGLNIGREGLRNLPSEFFKGEMLIQPQLAKERIVPSGKDAPFMVVFKDLSSQAKEFKFEITDAPNL